MAEAEEFRGLFDQAKTLFFTNDKLVKAHIRRQTGVDKFNQIYALVEEGFRLIDLSKPKEEIKTSIDELYSGIKSINNKHLNIFVMSPQIRENFQELFTLLGLMKEHDFLRQETFLDKIAFWRKKPQPAT